MKNKASSKKNKWKWREDDGNTKREGEKREWDKKLNERTWVKVRVRVWERVKDSLKSKKKV